MENIPDDILKYILIPLFYLNDNLDTNVYIENYDNIYKILYIVFKELDSYRLINKRFNKLIKEFIVNSKIYKQIISFNDALRLNPHNYNYNLYTLKKVYYNTLSKNYKVFIKSNNLFHRLFNKHLYSGREYLNAVNLSTKIASDYFDLSNKLYKKMYNQRYRCSGITNHGNRCKNKCIVKYKFNDLSSYRVMFCHTHRGNLNDYGYEILINNKDKVIRNINPIVPPRFRY